MTNFGHARAIFSALGLFFAISCGKGAPPDAVAIEKIPQEKGKTLAGAYRISDYGDGMKWLKESGAKYLILFPVTELSGTGSKLNWYNAYPGANGENVNIGGESWAQTTFDGKTLKSWKGSDGSSTYFGTFEKISLDDASVPENVKETHRLCEAVLDVVNRLSDKKVFLGFSVQDTDKILAFSARQTALAKHFAANIPDLKTFIDKFDKLNLTFSNGKSFTRTEVEVGSYLSVPATMTEPPEAVLGRIKSYVRTP